MRARTDARTHLAALAIACAGAWGCSSLLDYDELAFQEQGEPDGGPGGAGGATEGGVGGADAKPDTKTDSATAGSAGASGGSGGSSAGGGAGMAGSGGSADPCSTVTCGANQHCEPATKSCVCNPGFVSDGTGCSPAPAGDPTQHTEQEVCERWSSGHDLTDPSPWKAGAGECDPGTLSQAGITDTLTRMAMFRWMVGLGPVSDDAGLNEMNMYCAMVSSWNPPSGGYNPHFPDPSRKCYTAQGAQGAGQSNIAWGSGHPAHAIDQFIEDTGNETTMGHRRWIFNPPLGPVGIGYYAGGGTYGNAECLAVFGSSGGGTAPPWIAFPPPGFSPVQVVGWIWTFHHQSDVSKATITVTRTSDSADLPMKKMPLQQGYGSYPTVAFSRDGWTPKAGEVYAVAVDGVGAGTITYEVKPLSCN